MEDIESILDTLVYDGKVAAEMRASSSDEDGASRSQSVRYYRCLTAWCLPTGITRVPCAMCPVCINSFNCDYWKCVKCGCGREC